MFEKLVKRIIWVSKCPKCGESVEKDKNPPRERLCMKCNIWVPYKEESFIGPELKK
jgi:ribosomal protein L32